MNGTVSARRGFGAGVALILVGGWTTGLGFFTALLPWKLGVWTDTEPMVAALHGGALICAAGLLVCAWARPVTIVRIGAHPIVLAALFVAVWSAIGAFFVPYPLLSLLGSPQLGEGALYFADIAVYLAAGILLHRLSGARRIFVLVSCAVCVATPVLVWIANMVEWGTASRLFEFNDYLAYYAVAGALLSLSSLPRLPLRWRALLAVAVAIPGLAISSNQTAIVIVAAAALPAGLLLHVLLARSALGLDLARYAAAITVPMLAVAGVVVVWFVGQTGAVPSLTSRLFMYQALLPVLSDYPLAMAFGQGWGQINAAVLENSTQTGAVIWDGSWDLAVRDIPHSHNFAVEALSGAGLPAMLGAIILLMTLPLTARRIGLPVATFAAISLAGLGAMWFQLPATAGLVAVAVGLVSGPCRVRIKTTIAACNAILVLIAALQVAALVWLIGYGVSVQRAFDAGYIDAGIEMPRNTACGWFPSDELRGDIGLTQAFGAEYRSIFEARNAGQAVSPERWNRLERVYCVVSQTSAVSRSIRLLLADQLFRAQIAQNPALGEDAHRFDSALADWDAALQRFLDVAPARTDVAAPYLAWRLSRGEVGNAVRFAEFLLSRNNADPVGNWFLGAAMAAAGGGIAGPNGDKIVAYMRFALSRGVERFIKVDSAVVGILEDR